MAAINLLLITVFRSPVGGLQRYQFIMQPNLGAYAGAGGGSDSLIFRIDTTEDIPNSIFLSVDDAKTYFVNLRAQAQINAINTTLGTSHTLGHVYDYDAVRDTESVKKLADIGDLSTDMVTLLGSADWAAMKSSMSFAKSDVGLGNVDNTSDANKPISTATQTALDAKLSSQTQVDWTQTSSGAVDFIKNKPAKLTAITAAATDAPTNAPTNYGALAAILGADVNATNTKQNQTATNVNALAGKFNDLISYLKSVGLMNT